MKKTFLFLSLASLLANPAGAVTVYDANGTQLDVGGSARFVLAKTSAEQTNRLDLNNDGSRVTLKFSQALGDGLSALGYMELRPSNKDFDSSISTKYLYAGVSADGVGSLTFGNQKTAGDAFKLADPAEQDRAVDSAVGLNTSAKKVVHLKSDSVYGLGLEASYIFDDESSKTTVGTGSQKVYRPNLNSYQMLAKYENRLGWMGLQLNALYAHTKKGETITDKSVSHTKSQDIFGVALGLKIADLGIAVDYAKSKEKGKKAQVVELSEVKALQTALTYQVATPVDVYALFHHYARHTKDKSASVKKVLTNGFGVGAHYYLSQNVMTYLEYNRDKSSDVRFYDNSAYVGLRVYF